MLEHVSLKKGYGGLVLYYTKTSASGNKGATKKIRLRKVRYDRDALSCLLEDERGRKRKEAMFRMPAISATSRRRTSGCPSKNGGRPSRRASSQVKTGSSSAFPLPMMSRSRRRMPVARKPASPVMSGGRWRVRGGLVRLRSVSFI